MPLVRYSGPFLKWTREELEQIDQRTRKLMTMHNALHPRDDVDRLYVSRKEVEEDLLASKTPLKIHTTSRRLHRKTRTRTNYNHQNRYGQHDKRKNDNKWETKMGRKTTLWPL